MQTKSQIRQLLSSAGVTPNRKLGQHFLIDLNLMRLLLDSAQPGPEDVVLEVGCGPGSMTQALAERAGRVVAVEIDPALAAIARDQLAGRDNVRLVGADALSSKGTMHPELLEAVTAARRGRPGRLLLIANLPYDVASSVMANLVRGPMVAEAMYVTVQKEVAERMAAEPGGEHYGVLSILLGATGRVEVLRVLKPSVFWPPPRVDSAMVGFVRDPSRAGRIRDMALFSDVVHFFLQHRRKMLRACAKCAPPGPGDRHRWLEVFERCGVDPTQRPAELTPAQYIELATACGRGAAL